jgi:hypothetical protein
MGVGRGGDQHRVNGGIVQDRVGGPCLGPVLGGKLRGGLGVDVTDCDEGRAGVRGDGGGMDAGDTPGAEEADFQHG